MIPEHSSKNGLICCYQWCCFLMEKADIFLSTLCKWCLQDAFFCVRFLCLLVFLLFLAGSSSTAGELMRWSTYPPGRAETDSAAFLLCFEPNTLSLTTPIWYHIQWRSFSTRVCLDKILALVLNFNCVFPSPVHVVIVVYYMPSLFWCPPEHFSEQHKKKITIWSNIKTTWKGAFA